MYYLKVEESFDAAHFLLNIEGKCKNLHGHRWRVCLKVEEKIHNERGMEINFSDLKRDLKKEVTYLDHCLIYQKESMREETIDALKKEGFVLRDMDFNPTAENLACYFYKRMKEYGYYVISVRVYETPNNCVIYEE